MKIKKSIVLLLTFAMLSTSVLSAPASFAAGEEAGGNAPAATAAVAAEGDAGDAENGAKASASVSAKASANASAKATTSASAKVAPSVSAKASNAGALAKGLSVAAGSVTADNNTGNTRNTGNTGNTDGQDAQAAATEENFNMQLKLNAEQVSSKEYRNTSGNLKVKFTAEWSDAAKLSALTADGWTFAYKLVDQNGKTIKSSFKYATGYTYKVKDDGSHYKLVATASKAGEASRTKESNTLGKFVFPAKPLKVNAKCPKSENNVTLTWKKVKGATAYYIYRSRTGKMPKKPYKKVKKNKYVDENLSGKKVYRYQVQAIRAGKLGTAKYTTASAKSKTDKALVRKFLTIKIRRIAWYARVKYGASLYTSKRGGSVKGSVGRGTKVYLSDMYPSKVKRGDYPSRVYAMVKRNGRIVKSGWMSYSAVKGGINGEVAYRGGKAYDWTKSTKEKFVNKRRFSSKTRYLIWVSTYTQRVNIFKRKKGKWKLFRSHRCVTGRYLHRTAITTSNRVWKHKPKRVRFFFGSTTRQYWYHSLTFFSKGNSFHTICWAVGSNRIVNNIKKNCQPGTQGCVRCAVPNAVWIYRNIPMGTKVLIQ